MVRPSDRVFTISNALTLFRAFLAIPLIWMLETGQLPQAFGLIVLAVISDFLDGYLARHIHEVTNIGKMLDPIADKFILLAVMIFLIMDPERRFPLTFLLLLGTRDIVLSIMAIYLMHRRHEIFQTNWAGKAFIGITALAMTLYVLRYTEAGFLVLLVATALMLYSWYRYLRRYFRYLSNLPH